MRGFVSVRTAEEFQKWMEEKAKEVSAPTHSGSCDIATLTFDPERRGRARRESTPTPHQYLRGVLLAASRPFLESEGAEDTEQAFITETRRRGSCHC